MSYELVVKLNYFFLEGEIFVVRDIGEMFLMEDGGFSKIASSL